MVRVLVCGGRMFGRIPDDVKRSTIEWGRAKRKADCESTFLADRLSDLHRAKPISVVIHGAAAGADELGGAWAEVAGVPAIACPADWYPGGRYDPGAGPKRNASMLAQYKPDVVIAFTGGRGTADMIRRSKAAGVRVIDLRMAEWL